MQTIRASAAATKAIKVTRRAVKPQTPKIPQQAKGSVAPLKATMQRMQRAAQVVGVAVSSLSLAFAAQAAMTINSGDTIIFKNNSSFPHDVEFDPANVPAGVDTAAISLSTPMTSPGETYSVQLTFTGTYGIYCDVHQGVGMTGKIVVQ